MRIAQLAYNPINSTLVNALLELGYEVDLYAPGGHFPNELGPNPYDARVRIFPVEYGKRWLLKNIFLPHWRQYSLFSGSTEDPIAAVGLLSWIHRRPSLTLACEIFSGSYAGDRSKKWKRLCRWGMRGSRLNIVNDDARVALQREYAGLSDDEPVIVYPCCFRQLPLPADRTAVRQSWGMPEDALILLASGNFNEYAGADWLIHALEAKQNLHIALQPFALDSLTRFLLGQCRGSERMYIEDHLLTWQEVYASAAGADIGMSVYKNPAPQFQHMGISSQRLCMFLSMGIPVIASQQASFEFLERYRCGVLVKNKHEFIEAIDFIRQRLPEMKANATRCAKEYIDTSGRYNNLVSALRAIA